jgi:hypothetical protein
MLLYHWTIDRNKLKAKGFATRQDRHSDGELGVWFTDQLFGDTTSIKPEMRIVTVEIPEENILQYEETNKGSGYRAFRIPAGVANQYTLEFPTLYIDRGIYKIMPFIPF